MPPEVVFVNGAALLDGEAIIPELEFEPPVTLGPGIGVVIDNGIEKVDVGVLVKVETTEKIRLLLGPVLRQLLW